MRLQESHYNHFFKADDKYVLCYNAYSNSFARVDETEYNIIEQILKNPNNYNYDTPKKEKLKNDLIKGSFLIDEMIDEIELLKMKNKIGRFSTDNFGLTIAPTLDCNFNCEYCFEKKEKSSMSKEVEDALITFVEKKLEKIKIFSVTWFGGEPLIKIDTIERLVEAFNDICQRNKIFFKPQDIVTNGYLLTERNAKKLKKLNIATAQITIDGPPEIHNKRRQLKNGKATFEKILENIKKSVEHINIVVRINIDKDNYNKIEALYEIFERNNLLNKVLLYLGKVSSLTESCANVSSKCFNVKDFSSIVIDSIKKNRIGFSYPTSHIYGTCGADKLNSFVITPSGNLFKCWTETCFDEENSVGNVFNTELKPFQIKNLAKYLNWNPFEDENCTDCKYLPICSGGCPYFSLNLMDNCTTWKYYLQQMLKIYYEEVIINRAKKTIKP